MKLSFKTILPILLIFTLLILLAGCGTTPSPGYTPGTITGIIAAPCCSTSAGAVSEPQGVSPEYWCYDCENTWSLKDNIKVILTYGEDEIATTTTNEDGEYIFTNVPPGKNYVITAFCPDYNDDRPLVKDVALEVVEGETFDAKITDCVSTSLGLVVDFLVTYSELGPEEIVLDEVIAGNPNFWGFPRFKKLVLEVCRAEGECVNLNTDVDVQDALCKAAEEVGQIVLPDLDLGCTPGYTPVGGEGEGECAVPIADAGGPYSDTVCPGTENKGVLPVALIDLVGSGTGTGILSYAWDLHADGLFDDSAEQNPQDVAFGVGVHTVTLQVTDICGSTTDTATVTITESAGVTANAGSDQNFEVCPGATKDVDLVGSGTGTGTLSYAWDLDADGLFDDSAEQNPQDVAFGVGVHIVTLQVTDICGSTTDTATVTITESAGVTANAGSDQNFEVCPGATKDVDLVGSGTGTGTLSYAWDLDDDGLFDDSAEQNPQDVAFGVGVHTVTLGVTDYCGSAIDEMIVTITECINHAPTITPISDKNIAQGNTFHFTVSANDLDVDNLFYEIVSGPSTMTINSNTGAITWVAACSDPVTSRCHIICSKEVTVKVTDDGCCPLSAQDTFIINVWDQLP
jgi:PKD repeat protein